VPDQTSPFQFRRAVLALNAGPTDELVVRMGCQLAKPVKAELVALHVVEVDWTRELSDDISSGNEGAAAVLDMAEITGERLGVAVTGQLIQARDIGAAIVDEAAELDADLILVGLPYRTRFGGDFALGATVPYILQNAGSPVVVVREAIATSESRRG
jgi:nucleotide-binding universal stress UspA family protein